MKFQFFDALLQARKAYSRALEPVCAKWSLTHNELDVLLFLFNNPELDRASDIVSHRGIAKSHVSLSVSTLEERGLLMRKLSVQDRRTAHLALTEAALAPAQEGRNAQQTYFTKIFDGLTPEEFSLWRGIMDTVARNIKNLEE